jgi:hypothetical protein
VRDAGHTRLAAAFRRCLSPSITVSSEVPIGAPGDWRAWDHVVAVGGERAGVELESRLHDAQALARIVRPLRPHTQRSSRCCRSHRASSRGRSRKGGYLRLAECCSFRTRTLCRGTAPDDVPAWREPPQRGFRSPCAAAR